MCSRCNHSLANVIFNWLLSFLPAFLKVNLILIQVKNFVNYVIHQKAWYLFFKQLQKLLSNFLNQDIPNVFKTSFQLLNKTRLADQKVDLIYFRHLTYIAYAIWMNECAWRKISLYGMYSKDNLNHLLYIGKLETVHSVISVMSPNIRVHRENV